MKRNDLKLHSIAEWEQSNVNKYKFGHVYLTANRHEVRLVTGTVNVKRRVLYNDGYLSSEKIVKVRWDGFGLCWTKTGKTRKRDYDIHFN